MKYEKGRHRGSEIPELEIKRTEDKYPFKIISKDKTIEIKFFGKSISFTWWF